MEYNTAVDSVSSAESATITIYNLLVDRNERETNPFLSVHQANSTLLNQIDALRTKCELADREIGELRTQLASNPLKTGNTAAAAALKNEGRLRDKLERLQDEYNAKLKSESQDKALALETAKTLSQQKDLIASHESQLQQLENELAQRDKSIHHLQEQVSEAQQTTQLAEQQYEGLKETIRQLQEENEGLQKENRSLEGRMVADKGDLVDELNTLTEMMQAMKREVDMLREYKSQEEQRNNARLSVGPFSDDHTASQSKTSEEGRQFGDFGVIVPTKVMHTVAAHAMEGTCLRYDPSGSGLLCTASSDATVKVWDSSHGQLRATMRGSPGSSIIGCDMSNTLVVGAGSDKTCRVWNLRTQRMIHHLVGHAHKITCVRLYCHDKLVLTGSADRCLKVWDISSKTYKQTTTLRHSSTANCVDVAADAITAVSGHLDGGIRFWDLRSGERTADLPGMHEAAVTSVQFHPGDNTQVLTNSMDNSLKLIDVRTGTAVHTFRHQGLHTTHNWSSARLSPDGQYAIAGSNLSGEIFVWQTSDGALKTTLQGHLGGVFGIDWGRGSQQVASIDRKGSMILWA
jgi:autophagy-related protein 16